MIRRDVYCMCSDQGTRGLTNKNGNTVPVIPDASIFIADQWAGTIRREIGSTVQRDLPTTGSISVHAVRVAKIKFILK